MRTAGRADVVQTVCVLAEGVVPRQDGDQKEETEMTEKQGLDEQGKAILRRLVIQALVEAAIIVAICVAFPSARVGVLVLVAVLFVPGFVFGAVAVAKAIPSLYAVKQLDQVVDRMREEVGGMRSGDTRERIPYDHSCSMRSRERIILDVHATTEGERQLFVGRGDQIAQDVVEELLEYDKAACVQMDYTHFCIECWDSSKTSQSLYVKHVEKPRSVWDEWADASPEEAAIRQLDQAIDRVCAELGMAGPSSAQSRMPYDHKCSERSGDRIVLEIHATSEGERQLLTKHGDRVAQAVVQELPEYDAAACVQTSYDGFCVECWDSSKTSQSLHDKPVEKPQSVWDDPDAYFARHAEDAV